MAGKANRFLRQLISFAGLQLDIAGGVIQACAKSVHSSKSKISSFVVLLSGFVTAISLWNVLVHDRITRIFIDTRGDNL